MIISVASPRNAQYLYPNNNAFTAIFNDPIVIPKKAKITVHSAYLSFSPKIVIETNVNDLITFDVVINSNPSILFNLTVPQGTYTPQELANIITTAWANNGIGSPYNEISFNCNFNNLTGCFSFVFTYENSSAPSPDEYDLLYLPTNSTRATALSYIMGFGARNRELDFVCNIAGQQTIMEADNSVSYGVNNSPIALINVENFNIKNLNNYNTVAMRFTEHIRHTYAQSLNNCFITPYDKLYSSLNNDDEIILNSMDISIRNVDGSLMELDPSKATSILFEIRQEYEEEEYEKRPLQKIISVNPFFTKGGVIDTQKK